MFNWTNGMIGAIEEGRIQIKRTKRKYRMEAASNYAADMVQEWGDEWMLQWFKAQTPQNQALDALVRSSKMEYPSLTEMDLRRLVFAKAIASMLLY